MKEGNFERDRLRETSVPRTAHSAAVPTKEMKYCDLHCDALTQEGVLQVTKERLAQGGCLLQCFAAFVGDGGFDAFLRLADKFDEMCAREGYRRATDAEGIAEDGVNAMLTAEGDALQGELSRLDTLYARGVRIMGLVWNTPTTLGFPNFPDYARLCAGRVPPTLREGERGLTAFGFEAVARMAELKMLPDVSHGSDRLFSDVASFKRPFLAAHSNAASVSGWVRNLTDGQSRQVADCGGLVGLNFCADFVGSDHSSEGQRRGLLAHAKAIVAAGGEDVLAIGSDFDGIPPNQFLPSPASMPRFLEDLAGAIGMRAAEKAARDNVLRVFKETL